MNAPLVPVLPDFIAHMRSVIPPTSRRTGTRRGPGALPSLGALIVVLVVLGGNSWRMSRRTAAPASMSESERLGVLRVDRAHAEQQQRRAELTVHPPAVSETPATEPPQRKVEIAAARVDARPIVPALAPTERIVQVQTGETLSGALERLFVHGPTAYAVIKAYSKLRRPRHLRVGSHLFARLDSPSPMDAEALRVLVVAPPNGSRGVTITRSRASGKATWLATEGGVPGTVVQRALRCGVSTSLGRSLQRCGHGQQLTAMVSAALGPRVSLRSDVRPGDELRVVYDELVAAGERVRYERLHAVQYHGERAQVLAVYFADGAGRGDWYAADGSALDPMFLREPVGSARLTSGYGMRLHPILGVRKMHFGLDFAASTGTAVRASADGRVIKVASGGPAGRNLRLAHALGYQTEYMHLSRFARRATSGASVRRGQVIGFVGSTGRSTAPHLHYGVLRAGKYVDPVTTFAVPGVGVSERDRPAFELHAARMRKLLRALDDEGIGDS